MSRVRVPIAFTRIDRWLTGIVVLAVASVGTLLWLSESLVSPPRPRVSDSQRPTIGLAVRVDGGAVRVVRAAGPSREAGLRPGDVLVSVDDRKIVAPSDLDAAVASAHAGQSLHVDARRGSAGAAGDGVLAEVKVVVRDVSPADLGLPYEEIAFRNADGLTLRGWYIPPPAEGQARAPAVAYGHARDSDRRQWLPVAVAVHDAGFAQLLFDFTGRGESEGDVISMGAHEPKDLRSALDVLTARQEVDPLRLVLAGRDMGAAAAIYLAGEDARVKALVVDSPFADLTTLTDRMLAERHVPAFLVRPILFRVSGWRAHYDPSAVRPIDAFRSVKAPVLLLHGDRDHAVPYDETRAFQAAAGGPVLLVPLPGLDHDSPRPPDYADRIVEFLTRSLPVNWRSP